jgi:ABC-type sulfate transport system permease subunit
VADAWTAAFAVASLLAALALVTLVLKRLLEWKIRQNSAAAPASLADAAEV